MFRHMLTADTELRLLEPRHAAEVYDLVDRNRAHLGRWLSWVKSRESVDDMAGYIKQALYRYARDGSPYCGIWDHGVLAGTIDLMGINEHGRWAELGYWLDEAYQGRGLVSSACRALINYAFNSLDVNRVEIRADPANSRSRAVAERLGFTQEGHLRQVVNMGDCFTDRVVYAMLRDEWPREATNLIFTHPFMPDGELRLLDLSAADEMFTLIDANRERLGYWLDWVENTKMVQDIRSFCRRTVEQFAEGRMISTGIWYQGRYAGNIGLQNIYPSDGTAGFGYWLGAEFEGKGLVTNACQAIIRHAFQTLGLNRIQIYVEPGNVRSRAIPQRLGFQYEGTLREICSIRGEKVDMEVYALLREGWETQCSWVGNTCEKP